jgi:FixJ family two-component response regulator
MKERMGHQTGAALIGIVDDDESVRTAIGSLIRSAGYRIALFATADALLYSNQLHEIDCLIVDTHMPGLGGLELQRQLVALDHANPIIVLCGNANQLRETALRQGAVAVFGKPFSDEGLLAAVKLALESSKR